MWNKTLKQSSYRRDLKQLWNKSKTFQNSFSVLFQFRFTCASCLRTARKHGTLYNEKEVDARMAPERYTASSDQRTNDTKVHANERRHHQETRKTQNKLTGSGWNFVIYDSWHSGIVSDSSELMATYWERSVTKVCSHFSVLGDTI